MIREFAIEPELIVDWLSTPGPYLSVLRDGFGLGTPRIVSLYPEDWKTLVRDLWDSNMKSLESGADTEEAKGRVQFLQTRGEAVLQLLMLGMVDRSALTWHDSKSWLVNALVHSPKPLENILARRTNSARGNVLYEDTFFDSPQWNLAQTRYIPRDAETLANAVAPLLCRAKRLIFVDPYFRPERPHMRAFAAFLRIMTSRQGLEAPSIEVRSHANLSNKRGLDWTLVEENLRNEIEQNLPVGWKVKIAWLEELVDGEEVHNRYILSEIGGLFFGKGIDSGHRTQNDDVGLMSREQYDKRWAQHTGSPMAFKLGRGGRELVIDGKPTPKPATRGPRPGGSGPRR